MSNPPDQQAPAAPPEKPADPESPTQSEASVETAEPQAAPPPAVHMQPARHPSTTALLQFFSFAHLAPTLQEISRPFCELAIRIADGPQNSETTVALRKLLEAKDAAVRAYVAKPS